MVQTKTPPQKSLRALPLQESHRRELKSFPLTPIDKLKQIKKTRGAENVPSIMFHTQVAMRKYIRHPTEIPIELQLEEPDVGAETDPLINVSLKGLSFLTQRQLPLGHWLKVSIPLVSPPFETRARIVWSQPHGEQFEVGVELASLEDAYRTRMVEQICHIEHYRKEVLGQQGRQLSAEEAAKEWIEQFAADFPPLEEE